MSFGFKSVYIWHYNKCHFSVIVIIFLVNINVKKSAQLSIWVFYSKLIQFVYLSLCFLRHFASIVLLPSRKTEKSKNSNQTAVVNTVIAAVNTSVQHFRPTSFL